MRKVKNKLFPALIFVAAITVAAVLFLFGFSDGAETSEGVLPAELPPVCEFSGGIPNFSPASAASVPTVRRVANPVIFIDFEDEKMTPEEVEEKKKFFTNDDNSPSLSDYYRTLSFGNIEIETIFPYENNKIYIYRAPKGRSYYESFEGNTEKRQRAEAKLLNDAVKEADDKRLDYGHKVLNNSGDSVDCVTFIFSGKHDPSDTGAWGGLLWPHQWNLKAICESPGTLNGVPVDKYTVNFLGSVTVGLLCHEMGHVFGMPDLYHYGKDRRVPVGVWDLMHSNNDVPQFPLVYMRQKYLNKIAGTVASGQTVPIDKSGDYTLKAVNKAAVSDILAYRIAVNEKENIWLEYRDNSDNNKKVYDGGLPRSGLIVYRSNGDATTGNQEGKYHSSKHPDEVCVYRPKVNRGENADADKANLEYAALSPANEYFKTLGNRNEAEDYADGAIYCTDGTNTGIIIDNVSLNAVTNELTFHVDLNAGTYARGVDLLVAKDNYYVVKYGEPVSPTVKIKYGADEEYKLLSPDRYTIDYEPELLGEQVASIRFTDEGGISNVKKFTLKIEENTERAKIDVVNPASKTKYRVNEVLDLSGLEIEITYESGRSVRVRYDKEQNGDLWQVDGFESQKSGEKCFTVKYLPIGKSFPSRVTVIARLHGITIDEKNTVTVFTGNDIALNVVGILEDGTREKLPPEEYEIEMPEKFETYKEQEIIVRSKDPSVRLPAKKGFYKVNKGDLKSISIARLPKTEYRFGEPLNLDDGRLKFEFNPDKQITVEMKNYYNLFSDGKFFSDRPEKQTLTAAILGKIVSFDVTVLPRGSDILKSKNDNIKITTAAGGCGYIVLDNGYKFEDFARDISSYLDMEFFYTDDSEKSYPVTTQGYPGLSITDSMKVELLGCEKKRLATYDVYLRGDANSDGEANSDDLPFWGNFLFSPNKYAERYLDMNGDLRYDLTDFVLLKEEYGGKVA